MCCEDADGRTLLHKAAEAGHLDVVAWLVSVVDNMSGAAAAAVNRKVQGADDKGMNPLMLAVDHGRNAAAEFLWKRFVSVTANRYRGGPAVRVFHIAARRGNPVLLRCFASSISGIENAKVGAAYPQKLGREKEKQAKKRNRRRKKVAQQKKKEENLTQEDASWTSLHLAAHYGHAAAIAALAESGKADLNAEDKEGLRPIDLACMKGHRRAATAILDAGGVLGAGTKRRRASRLWTKARTSLFGDVREGVAEQERRMGDVARCDEGLTVALKTRNAAAIIDATDAFQEAKLALKEFRARFLGGSE